MKGTLKKCPSCGRFFVCQGQEDCWCEKIHIHRKDYIRVIEKYNDCLCRECLKQYAEQ